MVRLALSLIVLLLFPAQAHADRYTLEYEGAVFGVLPLGRAHLDIAADETRYDVSASLRSGGLLRLFDRTQLSAESAGLLTPHGLQWSRYDLDHAYAKKRRVIALRRASDGAVERSITPNYREWGEPPASEAEQRASRDPLSSLVAMAHDVARTGACAGRYQTFDGRFRYDLVLEGGKMAAFDGGGFEGPVLKCGLLYEPVAGYNRKNENERRRLPKGEIWFAMVGDHIAPPVRALVPLPVGRAGLTLRSFKRGIVDVQAEPDGV